MDVKQRQAYGLVRAIGLSQETAKKLVADGHATVDAVSALPEEALLHYKIKTKVADRLARIRTLKEEREQALLKLKED